MEDSSLLRPRLRTSSQGRLKSVLPILVGDRVGPSNAAGIACGEVSVGLRLVGDPMVSPAPFSEALFGV